MSWCGYIDMLGTRAMASRSARELIDNLDYFHSSLSENFNHFERGRCSAFSDGAFFVSPNPAAFKPFYVRVRNMLFQHGIFFRCSYIPGEIPMIDRETDENGRYLEQSPPAFRSFTFSGAAPEAYQRESTFKGVGCIITDGRQLKQHDIVTSFYVRVDGNKTTIHQFFDFRFSNYELSDPHDDKQTGIGGQPNYTAEQPLIDQTIIACHSALTQSAEIGTYFISAIASMIRSIDLKRVNYDEAQKSWENAPYIFIQFIDGGATKALKELPGLNLLLLACFDKLFCDWDGTPPRAVEDRVLRRLARHPSCFRNLDRVPEFVISGEARSALVRLRATDTMTMPAKRGASTPGRAD